MQANRKSKQHYVIYLVIALLTFSTCKKKYENGPKYSVFSVKSRLAGLWTIENTLLNDVDQTAEFLAMNGNNYVLEIDKDGAYTIYGNAGDNGSWTLNDGQDEIFFVSSASSLLDKSAKILRLSSRELWLRFKLKNGDVLVTKLKQ